MFSSQSRTTLEIITSKIFVISHHTKFYIQFLHKVISKTQTVIHLKYGNRPSKFDKILPYVKINFDLSKIVTLASYRYFYVTNSILVMLGFTV